jgi:hypothetical protein
MDPVMDVVDEGTGGRGGGGSTTGGNDSGTTLLNIRDEVVDDPLVITNNLGGDLTTDGSVDDRGVLSGGVVTPNSEVLDLRDVGASLEGELEKAKTLSVLVYKG